MKKIFYPIFCLSFSFLNAQDVIKQKDGTTIQSKVLEISSTEIKYKKFSNQGGPTYTLSKTEVSSITYESGDFDSFDGSKQDVNKYSKVPNQQVNQGNESSANNNSSNNTDVREINPPINDGKGIAKVHRLNGLDVFCLSVPLVKYTIVFSSGDLLSDLDAKSILMGGLARADVDDKMNKLINAALKKADKEGKSIDALIYSGGNRAIAVKYSTISEEPFTLSKVNKMNGIEVYAFSEPLKDNYEIIDDAKAKSGGFTSYATYGLVNSTIEDDINKMIERLDGGKKSKINAVIYNSGKRGVGIKTQ